VNDLLTQGLSTGDLIALFTQGLTVEIIERRPLNGLPIGLDFQLFVMDLAIATPSINSIVLDGASNQIITEVLVPAIDLTVDCSEVILNETIVNIAG